MTALLIVGLTHPPKEKYSLKPLTITVSGPTHPPKVKYSLKLQMLHIPVTQRQVRVQTSMRSSPYPPRPAVKQPAVPTAQRLPGPPHPPKVKYSQKRQQSTMRAARQVQEETSRTSSPESGNLTVRSVYLPLPEMAIIHKTMHDAIHAVRDQQGRAVTRRFLQQQQEIAASKLKCMSQIRKTSTPDPPPPKSNAFP